MKRLFNQITYKVIWFNDIYCNIQSAKSQTVLIQHWKKVWTIKVGMTPLKPREIQLIIHFITQISHSLYKYGLYRDIHIYIYIIYIYQFGYSLHKLKKSCNSYPTAMASGSSQWREINSNGPLGGLSGCTHRQIKPKVRQKNSIFRSETASRMPDGNKVYRVIQFRGFSVILHQIDPLRLITVHHMVFYCTHEIHSWRISEGYSHVGDIGMLVTHSWWQF